MTAPARMEKMIAMSKERTARMEQHLQALNKFYATLSPEQKKVFDQHTLHAMGEHGWGHGGHGMHGMHDMHQQGGKQG
jgi:protein CpxP